MADPMEVKGTGGAKFTVTPGLDKGYSEHLDRQLADGDLQPVKAAPARKPKPAPKAD